MIMIPHDMTSGALHAALAREERNRELALKARIEEQANRKAKFIAKAEKRFGKDTPLYNFCIRNY